MGLADRFWAWTLLAPTRHAIATPKREALVPAPHGAVQIWGEGDDEPELIVLRFLGARGRAELATRDPADRLELRAMTWTLNPPRFGASAGARSIRHYLQAATAAFDFLAQRYPAARLWVYGKCIGGTAAMYLATQRRMSGVIVKNIIDLRAPTAPLELNARQCAAAATAPCLFVIADGDEVTPPARQAAVGHAYAGSAEMLHVAGGHDDRTLQPADEPRYRAAVARLLERSTPPSVRPAAAAA